MRDRDCVAFLQWALPRRRLRWAGFRKVRRQVCRRLARRLAEAGLADLDAYRRRLATDPGEWEVFDTLCRVTISRFFRDRGVFAALERRVLPELAACAARDGRPALAAWSAGCASGEEAHSLRILWTYALAPRFPGLALEITATDIDPHLLERARQARYPPATLREVPPDYRERAFQREALAPGMPGDSPGRRKVPGDHPPRKGPVADPSQREVPGDYRLRPELAAGLALRLEDLRKTAPPGPFDLVLCRNLAFTYYARDLQLEVLARIAGVLRPGGALALGAHETLPEPTFGLRPWPGARSCWRRRAGDG